MMIKNYGFKKFLSLSMAFIMTLSVLLGMELAYPAAVSAASGSYRYDFVTSDFGHFANNDTSLASGNRLRAGTTETGGTSYAAGNASSFMSGDSPSGSSAVGNNRAFVMRMPVPKTINRAWIDKATLYFTIEQVHNGPSRVSFFEMNAELPANPYTTLNGYQRDNRSDKANYPFLRKAFDGGLAYTTATNGDGTDVRRAFPIDITEYIKSSAGRVSTAHTDLAALYAENYVYELQALPSQAMVSLRSPSHTVASERPYLVIEWSSPLESLDIPAVLSHGDELPTAFKDEVVTWRSSDATMLVGNAIKAQPLDKQITLTAAIGGEERAYEVTVTGILNEIDLADPLINGDTLPEQSVGEPVTWSSSDAAMLIDGRIIKAKAFNTAMTLTAAYGGATRPIPVNVTGILDGISLPQPITTGYVLPVQSYGEDITWTCDPPGLLVDGVITVYAPTTATLTARYGADTKAFANVPLTTVPPKNITFTGNEWTWSIPGGVNGTPAVGNGANAFQIGGENPRSRYFMYDTRQDALDYYTLYPTGYGDAYEAMLQASPSEWYLNLNGPWQFRYDRAPRNRVWPVAAGETNGVNPIFGTGANGTDSAFPAGKYGFDTSEAYIQTNDGGQTKNKSGWDNLTVPSNWQVNWNDDNTFMYDRVIYANQTLPWQGQYGNANPGTGSGAMPAAPAVSNGVGTHQRDFEIPESWANKRVFLNFDGADSFYVWVNGVPVGYSEDKFTHHEFDITNALRTRYPGGGIAGTHTITVQVIRWASGSHFEIQDFIRISGIFRSIYLMARNNEDLWDFQIDTRPVNVDALNAGEATDWTLNLKTSLRDYGNHLKETGVSGTVHYELQNADGTVVATGSGAGTYQMHETKLNATEFEGKFGDGVRWHAEADNRTAIGTDVTTAKISLAKPDEFVATIPADQVRPWSAEDPYLYKLLLWVDNGGDTEYTCVRVGFRYVDYSRGASGSTGRLLLNGKRLTWYGTNVHEANPDRGHVMDLALLRKDIEIMKRNNVDSMRMSHYPHDARLYDLADEYGLYIMDEANAETHFSGNGDANNLTNQGLAGPLLRDRQLNMLERTKNFASVVSWSSGNESGMTNNSAHYQTIVLEKREADITQRGRGFIPGQSASGTTNAASAVAGRPSHSEYCRNSNRMLSQLHSAMYPGISGWNTTSGDGNPRVLCEYAHAMGNSLGNFDSWIYIWEHANHDTGGFIWDWVDQGIWTPLPAGAVIGDDGYDREKFLAYGGDWGDTRNDGDFCANGILLSDRREKPHTTEMRRQYQRLKTALSGVPTAGSIGYTVQNMFMYTNANAYDMTWEITEDGSVIRSGSGVLDVPPVPYGTTGNKYGEASFAVGFEPIAAKANSEYFFNIQFRLREATQWQEKGYIIAQTQMKLSASDFVKTDNPYAPLSVAGMTVTGDTGNNTSDVVTITGPMGPDGATPLFEYIFDKGASAGKFTSMRYQGKEIVTSGPEPNFFRVPNSNERALSGVSTAVAAWRNAGSGRTRGNTSVTVAADKNCVVITAPFTNSGRNMTSANNRTVYTIYPDGEVKVAQTYEFGNQASRMNEMGSSMVLSPGLENITYFGRGPAENYIDRKWGNDIGVWQSTVADQFTEYIRTQPTGNHIDTRWLALTDNDGFGVVVKAGEFASNNLFRGSTPAFNPNQIAYNADSLVEFSALYYTQSEIWPNSRNNYHPHELFNDTRHNKTGIGNPVQLSLKLGSSGVGGDNTWGAEIHEVYRLNFANTTFNYNYSIMPVADINTFDVTGYMREVRNPYQNVKDLMPLALAAGVPADSAAYLAAAGLTATASEIAAINVYNNLMAEMAALKPILNSVAALGQTAKPNAQNIVRIAAPSGADLSAVTPAMEVVSGGETAITPSGAQDFSAGPVVYTLTDGEKTNTYTVYIAAAESAAAITGFKLLGANGVITEDAAGGIIMVDLTQAGDIDLSAVAPDAITFTGASISPDPFAPQNFNEAVTYTVKAIDGAERVYTVIVIGADTPAITGFTLDGVAGVIDHINNAINVILPYGKVIPTNAVPGVVFNGDAIAPAGAADFTSPLDYKVTLGEQSKTYRVTVTVDGGAANDITSFALGAFNGEIDGTEITVSVPYGTMIANVTPEIAISLGAVISPSGQVSFVSGVPKVYTVTSANGQRTKSYNVTVTVQPPVITALADGQSMVYATTEAEGASKLPQTVRVVLQSGQTVDAEVSWSGSFIAYSTATATGRATYEGSAPFTFTATVEVIKPGTVYFINSGTASYGSVLYDAVKSLMGPTLMNETSDKLIGSGTWGYASGTNSWNVYTDGVTASSGKTDSGLYGSANTAGRTAFYRMQLPAGEYEIAIGMRDWWNNNQRTMTLTLRYNDGTAKSQVLAANIVAGSGRQVTGAFTVDADATVELEFLTGYSQAQVVSWIQVSNARLVDPDTLDELLTNTNFALYVPDANKAGIEAKLPDTVMISTAGAGDAECDVVWDTTGISQAKAYETITVSGTATSPAGKTMAITADIEVVPSGVQYFIDANAMEAVAGRKDAGSRAYDSVKALVGDGLLNEIADGPKADGTWGYTGAVGTSGTTMRSAIAENLDWYHVENYTDKYNYGWFSLNDENAVPLAYDLQLPAGKYMITTGIQEFWPSTSNTHPRDYTVNVTNGNELLATVSDRLESPVEQQYGSRQTNTLFIELSEPTTITVSHVKTVGSTTEQPQLSWLAVAEQGLYITEAGSEITADSVTANVFIENYTEDATDCNSFLAVYDQRGALKQVQTGVPDIGSGKTGFYAITMTTETAAADKIRLFFWGADYAPLTGAIDVK